MESCMVWGLECGEGWKYSLTKLADQLEALNLTYWPKWHVRVQADQVKEKFGTLRFYYTVTIDPSGLRLWKLRKWRALYEKLRHVDYKLKEIEDKPEEPYDEKHELTLEAYVQGVKNPYKCTNVDYVEEDGKYYEIVHLKHCRKVHYVPTKNRVKWWLKNFVWKHICAADSGFEPTAEQRVIQGMMDAKTEALVKVAEDECYETCEVCGHQIGTDWSPRCCTAGWIRYICDDCAEKYDSYYKNGDLYVKGKLSKTKAQLVKEQNAAMAKAAKEQKKHKAKVAKAIKAKKAESATGTKVKKTNRKAKA